MQRDKEGESSDGILDGFSCHPLVVLFAFLCGVLTFVLVRIAVVPDNWVAQIFFTLFVFIGVLSLGVCLQARHDDLTPRWDYGVKWDMLRPERKKHWATLGYNEDSWEKNKEPHYCTLLWRDLPRDQKNAAKNLGYTARTWKKKAMEGAHECDPLVELPGHFQGGKTSKVRMARGSAWMVVIASVEVTVMLFVLSTVFSYVWLSSYHLMSTFLVVFTALVIAVLLLASSFKTRTRTETGEINDDRKLRATLRLCAAAILLGSGVGFSISTAKLHDYWNYNNMQHYGNVAPDQAASAHADASVLVFMDGSQPEVSKAARYNRQGSIYCVVPISINPSYTEDTKTASNIQFWAAGKNCCPKHEGFKCDDATNPKARSGFVISGERTKFEELFSGILYDDDHKRYEQAIKMYIAKFGVTSPKEHLIVRWVYDLGKARMAFYDDALWSWLRSVAWGFLMSFVMGLMVPLVAFRDEYGLHISALKQKVLKLANHHPSKMHEQFNA
jgi:hypothetical protein